MLPGISGLIMENLYVVKLPAQLILDPAHVILHINRKEKAKLLVHNLVLPLSSLSQVSE